MVKRSRDVAEGMSKGAASSEEEQGRCNYGNQKFGKKVEVQTNNATKAEVHIIIATGARSESYQTFHRMVKSSATVRR